jgi:hypothetical protein
MLNWLSNWNETSLRLIDRPNIENSTEAAPEVGPSSSFIVLMEFLKYILTRGEMCSVDCRL